jgi:hypothetical protein
MEIKQQFKGGKFLELIRYLLTLIFDPNQTYELIIRKYQERRSLRANNYPWALTDKLAEKMLVAGVRLSKQEMHAEMIFRYGQPEIKDGETVIELLKEGINAQEYYPYALAVEQGELNGKPYTAWRIYRSSHTYSKQEFSLFLKGIVEECREQGIQTEPPEEIDRMISLIKEGDNNERLRK